MLKPRQFTYAGTKDRRACTAQHVTLPRADSRHLVNVSKRKTTGLLLGDFAYCLGTPAPCPPCLGPRPRPRLPYATPCCSDTPSQLPNGCPTVVSSASGWVVGVGAIVCAARTSASCAGILIRLAPWLRLRAPAAGRPVRQPLSVGATRRGGGRRRCAASVPELGAPRLHQLLRPAALRHFCRPHARHRPRYPARGLRGGCGWSSALLLSLVTLPMLACSIVSFFPRLCPGLVCSWLHPCGVAPVALCLRVWNSCACACACACACKCTAAPAAGRLEPGRAAPSHTSPVLQGVARCGKGARVSDRL
jgi:hypothetical protein